MTSNSADYDRTDEVDGCAICMKKWTIACTGCGNIGYCSEKCQQEDAAQHNTICDTFKDFQTRPSDKHFRALYFPADEPKPRFIWLLMDGDRLTWKPNPTDLAKYVPGSPSSEDSFITDHRVVQDDHSENQDLIKGLCIEYDPVSQGQSDSHKGSASMEQSANMCFARMIGPEVGVLRRGGQVGRVHGWNPEFGQKSGDVDCTSLGPLLAWVMEMALC